MYFLFRNTVYSPLITLLAPVRLLGQVFFFPRSSSVVFFPAFKRTCQGVLINEYVLGIFPVINVFCCKYRPHQGQDFMAGPQFF